MRLGIMSDIEFMSDGTNALTPRKVEHQCTGIRSYGSGNVIYPYTYEVLISSFRSKLTIY